jgi:hypothetical protein
MTGDLFQAGDQGGPIDREADVDGDFRWSLKRTWSRGKPRAAWLMCNPSTADGLVDDPTIRRVMAFSAAAGCGSAIVVNVFPLRTPYPADLWPRLGDLDEEAIRKNFDTIEAAVRKADLRFVAFGADPFKRAPELTVQAVRLFGLRQGIRSPVVALGVNSTGWPLHPLARGKYAIRNGTRPVPWTFAATNEDPIGRCADCFAWSPWAANTGDCMAWARRGQDLRLRADVDAKPEATWTRTSAATTWSEDGCPEFEAKPQP